jgi:hypothetical protein
MENFHLLGSTKVTTIGNTGWSSDIALFSKISEYKLKIYVGQCIFFLNQCSLNSQNNHNAIEYQDFMDSGLILLNEINKRTKYSSEHTLNEENLDIKNIEDEYEEFGENLHEFKKTIKKDLSEHRVILTKSMNRIIPLFGFSESSGFYSIADNPELTSERGDSCHITELKLL